MVEEFVFIFGLLVDFWDKVEGLVFKGNWVVVYFVFVEY